MLNSSKTFFLYFLIFNVYFITEARKKKLRHFNFITTKVFYNTNHLSSHSVLVNPGNSSLSIILNVQQNFTSDPWVDVAISMKSSKMLTYTSLFSYDMNVCSVLGRKETGKVNYLAIWLNRIWSYGSLPKTCPIVKGNYSFKDLKLDKHIVSPILPNGHYKAQINTYFPKGSFRDSIANLTVQMILK